MMYDRLIPLLALFAASCATPTTDPLHLPAGEWQLDPAHASVIWQVRHMGLSWYTGRFDTVDARLDFDPARPEASRLTVHIDPASISTGDPGFDRQLAQDWFHAGRHPQIRFVSERVDTTGENRGRVEGLLFLNGHRAPLVLEVEFNGGLDNVLTGRDTIGFSATATLDRTDFGVGNLPQTVLGHEVRVIVEAEFVRRGAPT
jgi:polyisoprenoid-binding protein YceI